MAKYSVFGYLFININICTDTGEIAIDDFPAADNFAMFYVPPHISMR